MGRLQDAAAFSTLGLLALFAWTRDLSWASSPEDTLPILIALPLFFWTLRPWTLNDRTFAPTATLSGAAVALLLLGVAANLTLCIAVSWCLCFWDWVRQRVESTKHSQVARLMILPLLAFPWVSLDLQPVGWWFRLSGAAVTAQLFDSLGFYVERQGTYILVNHLPMYVNPACAGLNTLQSMLIVGSFVAFIRIGHTPLYWANLVLPVGMAWIMNTLRIITITGAALAVNVQFAMGAFHQFSGLLLLVGMGLAYWGLLNICKDQWRTLA